MALLQLTVPCLRFWVPILLVPAPGGWSEIRRRRIYGLLTGPIGRSLKLGLGTFGCAEGRAVQDGEISERWL